VAVPGSPIPRPSAKALLNRGRSDPRVQRKNTRGKVRVRRFVGASPPRTWILGVES